MPRKAASRCGVGKIGHMAAPNIVDLPPHNPGMTEIHRRVTNAFRVHWKTHPGATPQKLVLTQKQADDLELSQLYGGASLPGYKHTKGKFFDRPVEVSATTAGVLVAHDGTEMLLADYDTMPA